MMNVQVSEVAQDYINRLIYLAVDLAGPTANLLRAFDKSKYALLSIGTQFEQNDGVEKLTKLSQMCAHSKGRDHVTTEDIQEMVVFAIPYWRRDLVARVVVESVAVNVPKPDMIFYDRGARRSSTKARLGEGICPRRCILAAQVQATHATTFDTVGLY